MLNVSDTHRFRKSVAGLCMIAAPLLLLIGAIVSPSLKTDEAAQLSVVADHLDRWFIANLLFLVGWTLMVPATLGVMHMMRERGVAFGHVGGGLALLGVLAAIGLTTIGLVIWQMAAGGADQASMVALLERLNETAGTFILFFLVPFAVTLGYLVLCWGLQQTKIAPVWMTGPLGIGAVLFAVGLALYSIALFIVAAAFALVGFGAIGRMVLVESLEDWDHQPEFRGRPALGAR